MDVELRFGRFTLDCARRELRCEGSPVQMDPTGYRILVYLVQHRDRAVSRRELIDEAWPKVHVGASSLDTAIYQLRGTLRSADPSFNAIETLRGYGFLFSERVEVGGAAPTREASCESERMSQRDRQLLEAYGGLTPDGLWCFELQHPLPVSLSDEALIDAVLQDATLSFCNASLAATYGYADPSELVGRSLTDFLIAERPENIDYMRRVIQRRSVRGAISLEVDRAGLPRWISNDVTCVVRGNEYLRVCGVQRDVTEMKPARRSQRQPSPARGADGRTQEVAQALLEIQRLSHAALTSLASGESDSARVNLTEAHQRATHLRKTLA